MSARSWQNEFCWNCGIRSKNEELSQQLQQVSQVSDQLASGSGNIAEAVSALVVLGYSQSEAARAIAGQPAETSVQDLIKTGLKKLAGSR